MWAFVASHPCTRKKVQRWGTEGVLAIPYSLLPVPYSLLSSHFGDVVVEGGVAVPHEGDEGPDCQGGAEGELEDADKGGDHGDDASPGRAVHEAVSGAEGESGADQDDEPDEMDECRAEPHGREWAAHPVLESAVEEGVSESHAQESEGEGKRSPDEPDHAESAELAGVTGELELEAGDLGNGSYGDGSAALLADRLPGNQRVTTYAAIHRRLQCDELTLLCLVTHRWGWRFQRSS